MTYDQFKAAVARFAAQAEIAEYDLYYQSSASTTVRAYQGDIDDFSDKTAIGACFRCIVDGKIGYSHTQLLSEEEAARLVQDAQACAGVLEPSGFAAIFQGSDHYETVEQAGEARCDVPALRQMALDVERLALAQDSRVVSVPYAYARYAHREVALSNSHGLDLKHRGEGYTVICEAVAEAEGRRYSGDSGQESLTAGDIDLAQIVQEAVSLAVDAIGGTSIPSGEYPVVFSRRMMAEMLSAFSPIFSADAAQKGLSLLSGKENTAIASDLVTIIDDPLHPAFPMKTPFDDEGVATRTKTICEAGVLRTLLYDTKSAAKAGTVSTGNGMRSSYAGDVSVAPHGFYLRAGIQTRDELLAGITRGLYITELKGMHASANASTGDFSLESRGFLIEDGKLTRPIEQFTIAGNFYRLLEHITGIADDFLLEGGFGAATTLVSSLAVSGENQG